MNLFDEEKLTASVEVARKYNESLRVVQLMLHSLRKLQNRSTCPLCQQDIPVSSEELKNLLHHAEFLLRLETLETQLVELKQS